jgi:hypothetical protein
VIVQAEGQLVRTGLVGGQVFGEAAPFTVRFQFARNPNLAATAAYPLRMDLRRFLVCFRAPLRSVAGGSDPELSAR